MKCKFIFVDDDPDTRELYEIFLFKKLGTDFKYHFFINGEDCLGHLKKEANSSVKLLIFTDINMGHMNGLDFLSNIKRNYSEADVVVCSSYCGESFVDKATKLGAIKFMSKPINFELIREMIEERL